MSRGFISKTSQITGGKKQSEERAALFLLSECICLVMYLLIFSGFPVFAECLPVNSGNQTGAGLGLTK